VANELNRGGGFLLGEVEPGSVFVPERFDAEQRLFAKTAREFMDNEVVPLSDAIEDKDLAASRDLLRKAGELGLLMADVPEAYGGLGLDRRSSALVAENLCGQGSFQTMSMAHTGIGTLPIVYYGTEEQKRRYLPGLASGELVGAYCLTEPGAGSDALGVRTRAVLSGDGSHYVLNGTKQFITNGAIADVFTVFAKVDGERFTGFVLERDTPGLAIGPEEPKMGIRGSSTTTVILEDAPVPAENVLGEVGQGHKIAFNILNIGRLKLGLGAVGVAKRTIEEALAYALERRQFGRRIAEFGAVREKLGWMLARTYAAESAAYRTVGLIDALLADVADPYGEAGLVAIEEYSCECAAIKVYGSEMADFVTDEGIQILGGYGYCAEYPMERYYRDNRIARIYEGTNEINRIVVASMLLRKAAAGALPLLEAARDATTPAEPPGGVLGPERAAVANLKRIALRVLASAADRYGKAVGRHQGIVLRLADLVIGAFVAESVVLRALQDAEARGEQGAALPLAAARLVCEESVNEAAVLARQCFTALGDAQALGALPGLARYADPGVLGQLETIAGRLVEMERVVV